MTNIKNSLLLGLIALTSGVSVLPANAFTFYVGSQGDASTAFGNFQTAAGASLLGPEDFESFTGVSDPNNPAIQRNVTVNIGGISTTIGETGSTFGGILNTPFNSARNTTQPSPPASNYYLGGVNPGGSQNFSISTGVPVSGIGFYGTDIGDFNATLIARLFSNGVEVFSGAPPIVPVDGNIVFLGVIGAPGETFDEVQLDIQLAAGQAVNGDSFGIDDIYLVGVNTTPPDPTGTPEPGTLVGLALLGTAGFVSRRKNK